MAFGICSFSGVAYHSDIDLDSPVYKFYPMQRFLEAVENREMYFRNILDWEDNWELPTRHFSTDEIEKLDKFFIKKGEIFPLFATCFTSYYDTNSMWQIYSKNKNSICVETTARALLSEITKISSPSFSAYYAPVIYLNIDKTSPEKIFDQKRAEEYPSQFYFPFIKRNVFSYEQEIRLAVHIPQYTSENGGIKLPVNIRQIINKVILDPRLTKDELSHQTDKLEQLGIQVEQSSLFSNANFRAKKYEDLIKIVERQTTICGTKFVMFK